MMKNKNERKIERIGERFVNTHGNEFVIVQYKNAANITVEFECGYRTKTTYQYCRSGNVSCPFDKTQCGIGYIGLMSDGTKPVCKVNGKLTREYSLWCAMMNRVYNEKQLEHHTAYRDVTVHERWHSFSNFLEDLPELKGYKLWSEGNDYELDKDLLQQGVEYKVYSPETCMFIPREVNIRVKPNGNGRLKKEKQPKKVIRLTHIESGMYMDYKKQEQVADKLGVTQSYVSRLIGKQKEYKGYKIEVLYV
jgi:hypothetical protein